MHSLSNGIRNLQMFPTPAQAYKYVPNKERERISAFPTTVPQRALPDTIQMVGAPRIKAPVQPVTPKKIIGQTPKPGPAPKPKVTPTPKLKLPRNISLKRKTIKLMTK